MLLQKMVEKEKPLKVVKEKKLNLKLLLNKKLQSILQIIYPMKMLGKQKKLYMILLQMIRKELELCN